MYNTHRAAAWTLCLFLLLASNALAQPAAAVIPLAGEWRFAMDRADAGVNEKWFNQDLADKIQLPGILQSQGYGDDIAVNTPWVLGLGARAWQTRPEYAPYRQPGKIKVSFLSQPPKHYLGVAWYQRDVEIPQGWSGKLVHLLLERPRWQTTVYVDDKEIGSNNSLVAPHAYELGILSPGKHRLSIRIDNRMSVVPGYRPDGHSVSDALGATWNGIAGDIQISATSPVWIDDAQVFTDIQTKVATIKVRIGNVGGAAGEGSIAVADDSSPIKWDASGGEGQIEVKLPGTAELWDEFHPTLHKLTVKLSGKDADDSRELTFGIRQITTNEKKMLLNGREVNMRGTHFGGDFPLTGYPATDVASWKRIIQICKDFGLNHMRFHSWCPPEAAFTAADEMGFYLQPECGMWNSISPNSPMAQMLETETARMLKAYGNHPSFLLLSPSNEPGGAWTQYTPLWAKANYERDNRRLYAAGTGNDTPQQVQNAQFAIMPHFGGGGPGLLRGAPAWFGRDWGGALVNVHIPVLAHELGQWCAYPDFDIIPKFTGYMHPGNYEIFRDSARAHGVLEQNHDFAYASGKYQLACYKEEIEANQRTPGLSGFQLLDLRDYLGQGTALVGVLDAFWDPKSYVTAEEYRRFAGQTVPLARMMETVYQSSDAFNVAVEIAHYGQTPLENARPTWKIVDLQNKVAAQGAFESTTIPIGKNIPLGKVSTDLSKLTAPAQYRLVVGLEGTDVENGWNFWVYPANVKTDGPADVLVTDNWNAARARLADGGKVLFVPPAEALGDNSPPLNNVPVFWNRQMNPRFEAMMGLLIKSEHPALAGFPSQGWCDWQWTELVRGVPAVNIEKAPPEMRPIVQAIDDWNRNNKLGVVFESKVGNGRLVVCAIDLERDLDKRIGARQLRRSLLDYMGSDRFEPSVAMSMEQAGGLFPGRRTPGGPPEFNRGGRGRLNRGNRANRAGTTLPTPPPEIDESPTTRPAGNP
jgi:hypothetical protein